MPLLGNCCPQNKGSVCIVLLFILQVFVYLYILCRSYNATLLMKLMSVKDILVVGHEHDQSMEIHYVVLENEYAVILRLKR